MPKIVDPTPEQLAKLHDLLDANPIRGPLLDVTTQETKEPPHLADSTGPGLFRLAHGDLLSVCAHANPAQLCWGRLRWYGRTTRGHVACEGHWGEAEGKGYVAPPDTLEVAPDGTMRLV